MISPGPRRIWRRRLNRAGRWYMPRAPPTRAARAVSWLAVMRVACGPDFGET